MRKQVSLILALTLVFMMQFPFLMTPGITVVAEVVGSLQTLARDSYAKITAGRYFTAILRPDGTVVASGLNDEEQCNTSTWTDIVAISAGSAHLVGLKDDGSVITTGSNRSNQLSTTGVSDAIAIAAAWNRTAYLNRDGTVIVHGENYKGACETSDWGDIIAISAGDTHTVGVKKDGTVVATGRYAENLHGSSWTNIVAVAAGEHFTLGLRADGLVVVEGINDSEQLGLIRSLSNITAIKAYNVNFLAIKKDGRIYCSAKADRMYSSDESYFVDVSSWTNILDADLSHTHVIGLRKDGSTTSGDWTDIVDFSIYSSHTIGVRADGTALATGKWENGRSNV